MDLSDRLKELRDERKRENPMWTQQYVADQIGVARVSYTAYERGTKIPPADVILKIATIFDVSTDYLLGRSDIRNSKSEDDEIEELLNDPDFMLAYKDMPGSPEEAKEELIRFMKYLKYEEEKKKKK